MSKLILEYLTITDRDIPVITCYPEGGRNLPLVLINHGTTGSAEGMLWFETRLANEGFFCVNIDALWHGSRSDGKLFERLEPAVYKKNYLDMLLSMAKDMSAIIDFYEGNDLVNTQKVGMTGISQGGYVAFMTMTKDSRITAAAPMIGSPDLEDKYGNSPEWDELSDDVKAYVLEHSPLRNFEKMFPTALLVQASTEDTVVPIGGIRRLHEKLEPLYEACPEQYKFIEYPDIGHDCTREMQDEAVLWLSQKLKQETR
ncbi:MAG: hypothetical protein BGN88_05565 [Clostridiales bacterium 43-6]|nr:MAG: hypothetical protein BGN88_05565 [Clostridiales bacterium 43-6]